MSLNNIFLNRKMPVEIREIVIQAKVQDNSGAGESSKPVQLAAPDIQLQEDGNQATPDPEWIQKIVEICMAEMKTWMTENSIR